jgi:archaemetzincin
VHRPKTPPHQGDWLDEHPEPGQTFEQFRRLAAARPSPRLTTLYVQPIGEVTAGQQRLIEDTVAALEICFGYPVTTLPALADDVVPASARRLSPLTGQRQFLTTWLLAELLRPRRPADAVAVLALTATDLWPGHDGRREWNFVFGQASLVDRVGVWSLARYGDPEESAEAEARCLRRTLKVALHETGHMLGIRHCIAHECGMNGSNSLAETDRAPLWFCPQCEQKIWWACRLDPAQRYRRLAEFAERRALGEEAQFWQSAADRVGAAEPPARIPQ